MAGNWLPIVDDRIKVAAALLPLAVGGCSLTLDPSVPGLENSVATLRPISVPDVLASLKCQMTMGFSEIEKLKGGKYKNYPSVSRFKFKKGSGSLSIKVTGVETNGAKINAVIPFTGFTGTNATPSIGGTVSGTDVTEVKRTFEFSPDVSPEAIAADLALCNDLKNKNVDFGDFVTNNLIDAFQDTVDVPLNGDKAYGPIFKVKQFDITTSFSAVLKKEGGFSLKIVPSGPRLDSIGPSATINSDRTDVHSLTLTLPLDIGNTSDPRRIQFCVENNQKSLCREEPYTDEKWELRKSELDASIDADAGVNQLLRRILPNGLQAPDGEPTPNGVFKPSRDVPDVTKSGEEPVAKQIPSSLFGKEEPRLAF